MNTLSKVYCRTFQAIMKLGHYVLNYRIPETMKGAGSIKRLPAFIRNKGIDRLLVVTDASLMKLGLPAPMLEAMEKAGIACTVYDGVAPNPTSDNVEEGLKLYLKNGCKGIVAIGGGSPIDCAKAISARIVRPKRSVAQLQGLLKVNHRRKIPPFVAVPTTAGTGSETTVAAVITDAATHHKASINDTAILPHYAVLDPELTIGLPPFITATTGMDALCHAVRPTPTTPITPSWKTSMRRRPSGLIHDNLLVAYHDGKTWRPARTCRLPRSRPAAPLPGAVWATSMPSATRWAACTGRPMDLPCLSWLPHVMEAFGPAVYPRLARLADLCGMGQGTQEEKAKRFIQWIVDMKREIGIPEKLDMIKDEDVPQIITWAMKEANPLYPVPVLWGREEFRQFIDKVRV